MKIITNNPYRIIGLLADCTERDIQRQKGLIKRFLDVEKDVVFDTDIIFPINCDRDKESIAAAFSNVEQVKSRVKNGLFWFVNGNHIDETALNHLREGNNEKAIEIWNKVTSNNEGEVTSKNSVALHNLSTLKLGLAFYDKTIDKTLLSDGIVLKAKLINSEHLSEVVRKIADETYNLQKEEINRVFADELLANIAPYLDVAHGLSSAEFIATLKPTPNALKEYVAKKFIDKPLHTIEKSLEEVQEKRKSNKSNSFNWALKLCGDVNSSLGLIKTISGRQSLQYTMLSDKIAEELLRCSTDYFNSLKDGSEDPGEKALKITKLAEAMASGSKVKDKIKEDIAFLEKWIANKPARDKEKKIEKEYDHIIEVLDEFEKKQQSIANAKNLLTTAIPTLQKIRGVLGSTDELYLNISSRVGSDAQEMIVSEVNKVQDVFIKKIEATHFQHEKNILIDALKIKFRDAWDVSKTIGTLDMNNNFKTRYANNKKSLEGLCAQIGVSTSSYSPPQTAPRPQPVRTTSTNSNNNTIPPGLIWVIVIIVIFILAKACN